MFKNYDLHQFKEDLSVLNLSLSEEQLNKFVLYYELLIEWNNKINLTAITDIDVVFKKHFIDSLSFIKAFNLSESLFLKNVISLIDVGTGAGFPGLVLKIAFPGLKITLLDSLSKRVNFLNDVIDRLDLNNITAVHSRAEDFAKLSDYREQFDFCVSRAVANLSTLSEYCIPFVKKDGYFVSYKSYKSDEELSSASKAIHILGGEVEREVDFYLPSSDIYRDLIVIKKVLSTPKKYPRKAGLPSKEPL